MIYLGSHAIGLNTLLSPHIVITTPAGIATFKTSVSTPLVAGKVEFGPIQAGSGDPSPTNVRPITGWTGLTVWRTGKNLLTVSNIIENKTIVDSQDGEPINTIDSSASNIIRNACWVKSGVTYKLSYTVSGTPGSSNARSACITKDGVNVIQALRIQDFSTGNHAQNIIPSTDGYLWIVVDKATTDIQIELGSSESTYAPYTGQSYPVTFPALTANLFNVNATFENPSDTGSGNTRKRVFKPYTYCAGISSNNYFNSSQVGTYSISNGTITATTVGSAYGIGFAVPVKPETTYKIANTGDSNNRVNVGLYASDGTWLQDYNSVTGSSDGVFTTVADTAIAVIIFVSKTGGTETSFSNIMLSEGSTSQTYEPFTNTVYGGSLDVTTGVLTVDRQALVFDDSAWSFVQGFFYRTVITSGINVSEYYITENGVKMYLNGSNGQARIYLADNAFLTEQSDVATLLNGQKLVYTLATPYEIQLTPQQITTIIGDNTIWSDTNGENTIKYLKKG